MGLHGIERSQQTAKFVGPLTGDLVGEIAGRHAFGDLHGLKERLAHGVGKTDRKHDPDQCCSNRERKQGCASPRNCRFRFHPVSKAKRGNSLDEIVEGCRGVIAPLSDRKGNLSLREAIRRGCETLEFRVRPIANAIFGFRQRSYDVGIFDALADDFKIFRHFGKQCPKFYRRFVLYPATKTGRYQEAGLVQRCMSRTGMIDPHQRPIV